MIRITKWILFFHRFSVLMCILKAQHAWINIFSLCSSFMWKRMSFCLFCTFKYNDIWTNIFLWCGFSTIHCTHILHGAWICECMDACDRITFSNIVLLNQQTSCIRMRCFSKKLIHIHCVFYMKKNVPKKKIALVTRLFP